MNVHIRLYHLYRRLSPLIALAGLLVLALLAVRAFLHATETYGVGVRTDSVAYIWGAENLARGQGLGRLNGLGELRPMTHWPPLYPMLLAVFEAAGVPALAGARYLGAALVAAMLVLAGLTVWRVTRSLWISLAAAALLALAPSMWVTSLDAMTEPLYVVLGLAGALLLDQYFSGSGRRAFVLSALCMGLALLARYAGASLIGAAGLVLLLDRSRPWPARWRQALVYGLISSAPMLAWIARNLLAAGSATNRVLSIIPIDPYDWERLAATISAWLAPLEVTFSIGPGKLLLAAGTAAAFLGLAWLERAAQAPAAAGPAADGGPPSRLPLFYGIYALVYPLFVVFSRLAFDRLITVFEERIAFPMFLTALLLTAFGAWAALRSAARLHLAAGAALAALLVITAYSFGVQYRDEQQRVLDSTREIGRSLNSPGILESEVAARARALDDRRVFFTDNIEVLYFVSGHHSFQVNAVDQETLDFMRELAAQHTLTFVFFYDDAAVDSIRQAVPALRQVYKSGGSAIYTTGD